MVCRNCYVKMAKNGVSLTPRLAELFETHYNESIDLSNTMLPNVLCATCLIWLEKSSKNMIGKRPNSYKWHIPAKNTRLSLCCVGTTCAMCTEAFRFGPRKQANISIKHNLVG